MNDSLDFWQYFCTSFLLVSIGNAFWAFLRTGTSYYAWPDPFLLNIFCAFILAFSLSMLGKKKTNIKQSSLEKTSSL